MSKIYNFGAGPCILPEPVLKKASQAVINWNGTGLSILEISHRSPDFEAVVQKTENLVRELLQVPDTYSVLFLQGGASTQFSMVPLNFLQGKQRASYLDTGVFAQKAIKEARLFGEVEIVDSSRDKAYNYIPCRFEPAYGSAYLHLTSNNTIEGTEMFSFPKTAIPLVCDMSSDIFSRKISVCDFELIYAGAQKNLGPAGMTLVIAKNTYLDSVKHAVPSMSDYRVYRNNLSMFNTPPVFSIYVAMLNLEWLKSIGGVDEIEQVNIAKSTLLYAEIDRNTMFEGTADPEHRSRMNITFKARDLEIESAFFKMASGHGMVGISGYRSVGGFRVSLYNALPIEAVEALVELMKVFEKQELRAVPLVSKSIIK
ncbi:3-phosphoserine/phosphohydroxythreonine transaminase [Pedobacter jeongneungensis]|uniref:3-phosphoserine/phosphohydroxythreonine transaminase n=1 Tax=Pedobacter jeongneungensis TaxID=947309 RepID=UPI00046AEABF|nr:3-phosphoserine/phosphohydroxythreonine transaminase [Pedobacter jeongneungensis]